MASPSDRLQLALRRVNRGLNPQILYTMVWEYRVISATPTPPISIDCEAVDPETQALLPAQLAGIQLWPGPSGCVAVPQPGTLVRVAFANGDPAKPMVVGLDPSSSPLLVYLDGSPGPFVSRIGDVITITPAQVLAAGLTAATGSGPAPVTATAPLLGAISTGSTRVQCP